jgi:pyruvate dehydrogenase E2 component (dihydrolipoamide acetyltransferase)
MAEIIMPRLSDTMQEGTISRWLKQPGDEIKRGENVEEVETDKAVMEVSTYEAGILEQILVSEGETVPIGKAIAVIRAKKDARSTAPSSSVPPQSVQIPASVAAANRGLPLTDGGTGQRDAGTKNGVLFIKASPLARRIAEEHGIDLSQIKGTGPGGRIVRDDVEDAVALRGVVPTNARPVEPVISLPVPVVQVEEVEVVNLSSIQRTIARRLTEAKQSIPHIYIGSEIDMTEALAFRQKLNEALAEEGVKISINDLIVRACALALMKFPEANGSYKDGQFILHKRVNVGIAIDIPAGLIVPVIHDANQKGLRTIARESKELAAKAQAGKLTLPELDGGTFSISNLGMMDVSDFVAVVNPPQAAILAVAAVRKTFVPMNDQPVIRDMMHVTMSADHRILYGATVARFLREVKRILQNPLLLVG